MPRVNGDKPFRRARLQMAKGQVKHFDDLSTRYDRRDYGVVNVDKNGVECFGFTTGHYGTPVQAERIPSMVKATGGKYALPGTKRRRKGGKPNRMYHKPILQDLIDQRAELHHDLLHGRGSREQFDVLSAAIERIKVGTLDGLREKDLARERSEIGRCKAAGGAINRVLTVHADTVLTDQTPTPRKMPITLHPAMLGYMDGK